jgi:hypothetical protein
VSEGKHSAFCGALQFSFSLSFLSFAAVFFPLLSLISFKIFDMDDTLPVVMPKKATPNQKRASKPRILITKTNGLWPWQLPNVNYRGKYQIYIQSPHWELKRRQVIVNSDSECEHCGSKSKLTVHHIHYRSLFNEELSDLMCLCWTCHKKAEGNGKDKQSILAHLQSVRPSPPKKQRLKIERQWIFEGLEKLVEFAEKDGFHIKRYVEYWHESKPDDADF